MERGSHPRVLDPYYIPMGKRLSEWAPTDHVWFEISRHNFVLEKKKLK